MAGYIGKSQGVTQVDGYNRTEADDRYVNASGDTMTGALALPAGGLTVGTDQLSVDASGNVLVGTTDTDVSDNTTGGGFVVTPSNGVSIAREGTTSARPVLALNQTGVDGEILKLLKDGTTVGSIGVQNAYLTIGKNDTGLKFQDGVDGIHPWDMTSNAARDAAVDIGYSANRFKNLYLSGDGYFGKTTTAAFNTTVGVAIQGSAGYINACRSAGPAAYLNRTTSTGELVALMYDGVTKGNISVSASAASFNTTSDYRLKENVVDLTGATDRLKQIPVHRFNFIADPDATVDGFLAHEVQEIVPEAVTGTKDAMRTEEYEVTPAVLDADGNVVTEAVMGTREVPDYQGIDQSKLVPLLTAALQEALGRIEILEADVAALKGATNV